MFEEFSLRTNRRGRLSSSFTASTAIVRVEQLEERIAAAEVALSGMTFVSQLSVKCSPNYLCQYACAAMLAGKAWGSQWATKCGDARPRQNRNW